MFSIFSEYGTAQRIISKHFHVIFYAENSNYFQYFAHLYNELQQIETIRIAYITSDKNDPVLSDKKIESYYLNTTLAGTFPRLQADVMIMTMPDLQNFIFKRSATVKKYIYVFHAMVSTHQQYRAHAFDHYDAIFCTGPCHRKEIRESEALYSLPRKELIDYGYPLLNSLRQKVLEKEIQPNKVLIAPSWYKEGILNTCILPLVDALKTSGCEIWIRPHPEFIKRNKKQYLQLEGLARKSDKIFFDTSSSVFTHLTDAGHLITDRSGIALEYAFATYKPVLFIDTPLKVQNNEVARFTNVPLENHYRNCIGRSIGPNDVHLVTGVMKELRNTRETWQSSIKQTEEEAVFSPAQWENGIRYIRDQLTL
ncbi:MAG TPA: hypothetical protein VF609_06305 [Flavisolibacter sp.]